MYLSLFFDKDESVLNKLKKTIKSSNIKNIALIRENSKIPSENNYLDVVSCYDTIHYENLINITTFGKYSSLIEEVIEVMEIRPVIMRDY